MSSHLIEGDCLAVLPTLAAKSVQCVVTSPPYWGLRSYGFKADDPARKKMIGLEPTFERHLWNLVRVFREVRRVLRDDGTVWLNYGDAYAGSWGNYAPGGIKSQQRAQRDGGERWDRPAYEDTTTLPPTANMRNLPAKNLIGMAWRVAFALQTDGWILRSDIIWHKRSPMPESVRDRPTKAHEYVFLLTKSPRYFYDQEAGRERCLLSSTERMARGFNPAKGDDENHFGYSFQRGPGYESTSRNMRSVWTLSTEPMKEAHFATFPPELVARCLRVGTSSKGCCRTCGAPWKRITESERRKTRPGTNTKEAELTDMGINRDRDRHCTETRTVGWRMGCECELDCLDSVPCTVLDPFAGSGTVGLTCRRMGLNFIGIELNLDYVAMAKKRIARAMDEYKPNVTQSVGQMELIESEAVQPT